MPIFVMWIWKCDFCRIEMRDKYETSVYSDEMTGDNRGWTSNLDVPEEYRDHPMNNICITCPECRENPDWSKYMTAVSLTS